MARIYGLPGPEHGDQLVFEVLHTLPDDWIIYAQPCLVHGSEVRNPDYALCNGPPPEIRQFENVAAEHDYMLREIERYRVPAGVQIYEVKRQAGLEYRAVFIPQVQKLVEGDEVGNCERHKEQQCIQADNEVEVECCMKVSCLRSWWGWINALGNILQANPVC